MVRREYQVDFKERERRKRTKLDKRSWERDINKLLVWDVKSKRQDRLHLDDGGDEND